MDERNHILLNTYVFTNVLPILKIKSLRFKIFDPLSIQG